MVSWLLKGCTQDNDHYDDNEEDEEMADVPIINNNSNDQEVFDIHF